jgi:hypothetical protein
MQGASIGVIESSPPQAQRTGWSVVFLLAVVLFAGAAMRGVFGFVGFVFAMRNAPRNAIDQD